jgi:hypothetical protein
MGSDDGNFQGRSVKEGREVQAMAEKVLKGAGFKVTARNHLVQEFGATLNFVADDRAGESWQFDVSGSFTSQRAGLIRTDTLWKALGRANVLNGSGYDHLVFLTTNLPKPGSIGARALQAAAGTYFDAVEMLTPEGKQRLRQYAAGGREQPLPGFHQAASLYPSLVSRSTEIGLRVEVPLDEIKDGLPAVARPRFDVTVLPHRMKVFVPSKDADGKLIRAGTRKVTGEQIIALLSAHAGGCTGMEAVGAWVDPVGGVMHEQVAMVEAYAPAPFPESVIEEIVALVAGPLAQHTVALVVDNRMVLVTPSHRPSTLFE